MAVRHGGLCRSVLRVAVLAGYALAAAPGWQAAAAEALRDGVWTELGDVEITADTTWAEGQYRAQSLRVTGAATLSVVGGSVVEVVGPLVLDGNATLLLQGKNTAGQVEGAWAGAGVTVSAASAMVEAGSAISADGQGYACPGYGAAGVGPGSARPVGGGSHGGTGGAGGPIYGVEDMARPTALGSAGGGEYVTGWFAGTGGSGGGAVRLVVSGTLQVEGRVSADGLAGQDRSGGGSGGSLWIDAGTLTGAGAFTACGGSATNGGGGGRVAVYSRDASAYTGLAACSVAGGNGTEAAGAAGTMAFFGTAQTPNDIDVYAFPFTLVGSTGEWGNITVHAGAVLDTGPGFALAAGSLTVLSGGVFRLGGGSEAVVDGALTVARDGRLLCQGLNTTGPEAEGHWVGRGAALYAGAVSIAAGGAISADGQGYICPGYGAAGVGPGSAPPVGGGSHAGRGSAGGPVYGHELALTPTDCGSAGSGMYVDGWFAGTGGNGGGAIRLVVTGPLQLDGTISADGLPGTGPDGKAGGGAGGSVWVETDVLAGSGTLSARGGSGMHGGGGGRVAVYSRDDSAYGGRGGCSVAGGTGGTGGAVGGLLFVRTATVPPDLEVRASYYAPAGSAAQWRDVLVVAGGVCEVFAGFHLQAASLTVAADSELSLGGTADLSVAGLLSVAAGGRIVCRSVGNAATDAEGHWLGRGVALRAGSLVIEAGGAMSADGQGYLCPGYGAAGAGPGARPPVGGGSYGGAGAGGGPTYGAGLYATPVDLGSAGSGVYVDGWFAGTGGSGGGAMHLVVRGTTQLDGRLSADGGPGSGKAGGGAGGSLWVETETLRGTGTISAVGGNAMNSGGGGRVAVYAWQALEFPEANITAAGGSQNSPGGQGSLHVSSEPFTDWTSPTDTLFHGTETLGWNAVVQADLGEAILMAYSGGNTYPIASGLPLVGSTEWDTGAVPDGVYLIRVVFVDTAGQELHHVDRGVLVNNALHWHSGVLAGDEVWGPDAVHLVDGALTVPAGVTLTILPGTVVKFAAGAGLSVAGGGVLDASQATPGGHIVFTALSDDTAGGDTNLDGSASLPFAGWWPGLGGAGTVQLSDYAEVRYAPPLLVSGWLPGNTTWYPWTLYRVSGSVVVPSGATLTVLPGTVVKFEAGQGIEVRPGGSLVADGTHAQPVHFTSIQDDSVGGDTDGDGGASPPYAGDWQWLHASGGTITLDHARVSYGGAVDTAGMVHVEGQGVATLRNSLLREALYEGVMLVGGSMELANCVLAGADRMVQSNGGLIRMVNCTVTDANLGLFAHGGEVEFVNSILVNCTTAVSNCCGSGAPLVTHSDVWNCGDADDSGSNGNLHVDPGFRDAPRGDYRLGFVSPCIDAADGSVAAGTDAADAPRYDDPRSPNTGVPTGTGVFADMGAFEFVESAESGIDLVIRSVSGPLEATAGDTVTLAWEVLNVGSAPAVGPWHETVWLVPGPDREALPALECATVLSASGVVLGPGQAYNMTASVPVPGGVIGVYRWQVEANSRGDVFEGRNRANNTGQSQTPVTLDLPELVLGGPAQNRAFTASGTAHWFKVVPGAGRDAMVTIASSAAPATLEVYAARGRVPSALDYDVRDLPGDRGSATLRTLVPAAAPADQSVYVTAFCRRLPSAASLPVTVAARELDFEVVDYSPREAPAGGPLRIAFVGGLLAPAPRCTLTAADGVTVREATRVEIANSTLILAEFDLAGLPPGTAVLHVGRDRVPGASTRGRVELVFEVQQGVGGSWVAKQVNVSLAAPSQVREGGQAPFTLTVDNGGTSSAWGYVVGGGVELSEVTVTIAPDPRGTVGPLGLTDGVINVWNQSYTYPSLTGAVREDGYIYGAWKGHVNVLLTGAFSAGDWSPVRKDRITKSSWFSVNVVASSDPNDKYGTAGSGPGHSVLPGRLLNYVVTFENQPEATAPAATVVVMDHLDPSTVDLATFSFGQMVVGRGRIVVPPAGLSAFRHQVDLRPADDAILDIDANLDAATGAVVWRLAALDPLTRLPTPDPRVGFLPPNRVAPEGDGSVTYSVRAKADLPTGTRFEEHATIVFDYNDPIDTSAWLNIIDAGAPTSAVQAFPPVTPYPQFAVSWGGSDDAGGSGIGTYDVYVAVDGGPFSLWQDDTAEAGAVYDGQRGHAYAFYAVAQDGVGNTEVQPQPIAAEAQAWVPLADTDTDADGLPDWFEAVIINANAGDAVDGFEDVAPLGDFDGDTAPNLQEYRAETDPSDPGDVPGVAAPNGPFLAVVAAPGRGWWDLTGPYATMVSGLPLTLDPTMDTKGKIAGMGHLTLTNGTILGLPIKGSAKGSAGALVVKLALKGATADKAASAALALNLTLNAATRQLTGPVTGSITVDGIKGPVNETLALAIPPPMDGTWTLLTTLVPGGKGLTGTATLTLANGSEYDFLVKGKVAGETAVVSLSGGPADPLAKGIKIKATLLPRAGQWAILQVFSGKGFGQALGWGP